MPLNISLPSRSLSKAYGKKDVLKNIWLSFYPGAKIGVIGGNGSGKSTLLRIMAGIENDFIGTARPAGGITIGYLPQEPQLDPNLDVRGNVEAGRGADPRHLARFDEINARLGEGPDADEMDDLARRAGQGAGRDRGGRRLGPRPPHRDRHGRHAASARRRRRQPRSPAASAGASPSARSCSSAPTSCLLDEPTNHLDAESVAWLERHLQEYPGTVVRVTHDRYFLDNVAKWILELDRGQGIPWEGNYSSWLEQKQARLALEEKQESPAASSSPASSSGSGCRPAPAWPRTEHGSSAMSSSPARTPRSATRPSSSRSRRARTSATLVVEAEGRRQGLRRQPACSRT